MSLLLLLVSSIDTKSAPLSLGTTFPAAALLLRVDEAVADLLLEELLHVGLPLLQLLRQLHLLLDRLHQLRVHLWRDGGDLFSHLAATNDPSALFPAS